MKTQRARRAVRSAAEPWCHVAVIVALDDTPGRVVVRAVEKSDTGPRVIARMSRIAGYVPSEGDRVLVATAEDEQYVIAVLHAATPVTAVPGGGTTVSAPEGDLVLEAPSGRVVIRSGVDVTIEAARDIRHQAGRTVGLSAGASEVEVGAAETRVKTGALSVEAKDSRVVTGQATIVARRIATTAAEIAQHVERFELDATRIVERAKDTFRDVADLVQTRAGRLRTVVTEVCSQHARRTVITSKEETSIDGSKVLLG